MAHRALKTADRYAGTLQALEYLLPRLREPGSILFTIEEAVSTRPQLSSACSLSRSGKNAYFP